MDDPGVRERLEQERRRVLHEISILDDDLAGTNGDQPEENAHSLHMAESASAALDREVELTLEDNARHVLSRIERALAKLEAGTYGTCDRCGAAIDPGRLRAVPEATLCIACQQRDDLGR